MRRRAWQRGTVRAERHLWQVPTAVAVTTALAQGGFAASGSTPPSGADAIDVSLLAQAVPAGGSLSVPVPAIPAGQAGFITALGLDTSDAINTRVTTRVNGVAVPPLTANVGAIGTALDPVMLGAPIALAAGDVFDLFIEDLSGAGLTVGPRIIGFRS